MRKRLSALSKEDDSKRSPEEKSVLEAAKIKALRELPNLVKAIKQYEAAESTGTGSQADDRSDFMACVLYGALNKTDMQTVLTPEQARIFADLLTHFQPESRRLGFNFSF